MEVCMRYKLEDYEALDEKKDLCKDVEETIRYLKELFINTRSNDNKKRHRGRRHVEVDPNFKATEWKEKKEGLELLYQKIYTSLNKFTKVNYIKLRDEIFINFEDVMSLEESHREEIDSFIDEFINRMITNKAQLEIIVSLFSELNEKYSIFNNKIEKLLSIYEESLNNIKVIKPDENYDEFCNNNTVNTRRKNIGLFLTYALKKRLLMKDKIIEKIKYINDRFLSLIKIEEKKGEIDELAENAYVLITNSMSELYKYEEWEEIIENVKKVTKLVVKEEKSFTSRAKFKHMDIITDYEKFLKDNEAK